MGIFTGKRLVIATPEQTYLEINYAGFTRRALAVVIDTILVGFLQVLVGALLWVVWFLFRFLDIDSATKNVSSSYSLMFLVLLITTLFIVAFLYFFIWEYYGNGATPGKLLLGIRVMRKNGVKLDFTTALLRNLFRLLDALPILYPYLLGAWVMLLSKDEQRIGDIVADTVVVTLPRARSGAEIGVLTSILLNAKASKAIHHKQKC